MLPEFSVEEETRVLCAARKGELQVNLPLELLMDDIDAAGRLQMREAEQSILAALGLIQWQRYDVDQTRCNEAGGR